MEDGPQILPPPTLEPISRPSSTSTSASATLPQLPGISSLTPSNGAASTGSPQLRATNAPAPVAAAPPPTYNGTSPAATTGGAGVNLPTCQNCSTSTTPLWRRDESGAVLCNACGLFLKLHGRPRPISLKTDVIKSRNRVKTAMRPDMTPKKKQQQQQQQAANFPLSGDPNTAEHNAAVAAAATRRASQKSMNGNHDGTDSPGSRTGTPSMYPGSLSTHPLPPYMVDDPYQSSGVNTFGAAGSTKGRAGSPMNGDRNMEAPQTHEQLIAHNSSLKTRVSELEFINELFQGRLSQLEQQEAATRRTQGGAEPSQLQAQLEASQESEAQLRAQLEDSHRRENSLKRRLDELELELKEAKEALEAETARPTKKARTEAPAASEPRATESSEAPAVAEPVPAEAVVADPAMADSTTTEAVVSEAADSLMAEQAVAAVAEAPKNVDIPEVVEAPAETETTNGDKVEDTDKVENTDKAEATAVDKAEQPELAQQGEKTQEAEKPQDTDVIMETS